MLMSEWNETGFRDSDFLSSDHFDGYDDEQDINCSPHTKRECEPRYVCKWHGSPKEGT